MVEGYKCFVFQVSRVWCTQVHGATICWKVGKIDRFAIGMTTFFGRCDNVCILVFKDTFLMKIAISMASSNPICIRRRLAVNDTKAIQTANYFVHSVCDDVKGFTM